MHFQNCPVCQQQADVSIFVTGQKARCGRCGNKFVVERTGPGGRVSGKNAVIVDPELTNSGKRKPILDTQLARKEAPKPPPPTEAPGGPPAKPVIPGYTLDRLLGQGAMGSVWKAQEVRSGDPVAIKVLVEHLAKTPDFILRFEREAKAMAVVNHSGVVRLRDRGSHGGVHYLVMEFVDGEPIRREMERTRMPPDRAVAICRRVARGLEAAHRAGIVHRDLKPENILLSRQGELKIVDFGLAGLAAEVDPHPNLTRSRVTMGTMNYMAPEQRTDAKRVTRLADIYSLGVILFEMLTRELPLGRFSLPFERGLPLPPMVDDILRKSLAQEASQRQQTALQFDQELEALERELKNPPTPEEAASGKRKWWPFT